MHTTDANKQSKNCNTKLGDAADVILDSIGVPYYFVGREYIRDCVELFGSSDIRDITKGYKIVADKHGKRATQIERDMRHALEAAFNRYDAGGTLAEGYGIKTSAESAKMTNKEFVFTVLGLAKRQLPRLDD